MDTLRRMNVLKRLCASLPGKTKKALEAESPPRSYDRDWLAAHALNTLDPAAADSALRLNLGCGAKLMDGWLNADVIAADCEVPDIRDLISRIYVMDATEAFPFRDGQFEYVYCEDFLEHFAQKDGMSICVECFRVLKPGGTWRMSTPSFDKVLKRLDTRSHSTLELACWDWGHKLLYTEQYARDVLEACGFAPVVRCEFGQSDHPSLQGIDTREEQEDINLILEATKPRSGKG